MTFDEVLDQVRELLRREGRVSYRALKRRFAIDDGYVEDLKAELIDAKHLAVDEDGKVLVWVGNIEEDKGKRIRDKGGNGEQENTGEKGKGRKGETEVVSSQLSVVSPHPLAPSTHHPAERRQLTVMFCDLVGSTALSAQLDPEEYREVVRAYQETCTNVTRRYDGHIAQHLGDGLLVYFGYPAAHEDDAVRAVRAGLEIITAIQQRVPSPLVGASSFSPSPSQGEGSASGASAGEGSVVAQSHSPHPNLLPQGEKELRKLQVRIGIHTGLVVIGEIGSSEKREILALGETPNIAARIQGQANPDDVMISAATYRLVEGLFACEDRGQPDLKGLTPPLTLYRVVQESEVHSRFEVVVRKGLTPLIGRDHEFGLLRERWERVKDGAGQVVLLSGEPGIGKSRLVEALKETVKQEGARCLELRCSPYAQNSALRPVIEHLQRALQFQPEDSADEKLRKLEAGARRAVPRQAETVPLLAALLSLPHPDGYPPLTLSPQKQKEKTYKALVDWLGAEATQQAVTYAWEDLHWADPSTLELLTLLLAQVPTTRLLAMLTFRPEFTPPWGAHSYLSQVTLSRLGRSHVETLVEAVTGNKALSKEIIQQIVSKTDGVPLFVEELTKSVVEAGFDVGASHAVPLPLGIPATLQDALMARLDRLGPAKEIAQLGATLGRDFTYELLHAVAPLHEDALQQGLRQLVETELVFQSGVPPQARYLFKHALVQDTAYQSLLKSRRQQLHQQVAQVLEEKFPHTVANQPELLAHHYTEAGLITQAIPYWQQAGQGAVRRSANAEAVNHLTRGLKLLETLPDVSERTQLEFGLQTTLGPALMATKGWPAPEVRTAYTRARELCRQVGETPQLFPVLEGLQGFYILRAELQTAQEVEAQCFSLAQRTQDPALLLEAYHLRGCTSLYIGELSAAHMHLEQATALYDPREHGSHTFLYGGHDPGVCCYSHDAFTLWLLGYPNQAEKSVHQALRVAQELSHPINRALALYYAAWFHQYCQEEQIVQERAEACMTLCTEQGLPFSPLATMLQGWALAKQGAGEKGIAQIRGGLDVCQAAGSGLWRPYHLALLAEAYGKVGQAEEGLNALSEALTLVDKTGERIYEAELYRLKGKLTLQSSVQSLESRVKEAEKCFLKGIAIAQRQQAKSLELRATTSLARLWQQHGKKAEGHKLLAEIYNWFTEGFDTKDLQEAKTLLEALSD